MGGSISYLDRKSEVVKALLKEIIPWFGLRHWNYVRPGDHNQWVKPRKRINHTLKRNISKICQETNITWNKTIPVALPWIIVAPRSRLKLSPFKILYHRPFQVSAQEGESINAVKDWAVTNCVKTLDTIPTSAHEFASNRSAYPTEVNGNFIVAREGSTYLFNFIQMAQEFSICIGNWKQTPSSITN